MSDTSKRENIEIALVIIGSIIALVIVVFAFPKHEVKVYDCGMAEWHPDIPNEVKEQCRKLRAENFNKDLQKPK